MVETTRTSRRLDLRSLGFLLKRAGTEGIKHARKAYARSATVSLNPAADPVGRVLLSYVDPSYLLSDREIPNGHTEYWEALQIARTFLQRGYAVDWISYQNDLFEPRSSYSFMIDTRKNIERLTDKAGSTCIKIMHINTSHVLFHNAAQSQRLLELQQRRGIMLRSSLTELPNLGIEHSDCATLIGNSVTEETFAYAQKPIFRLPISTPVEYKWPEHKDFDACRNNFIWFGSNGLVHKGLDLVLEAFAQMPDCHLTVCGPISGEPDFERAFHRELYELPNITTVGWIDIESDQFRRILETSVALVFPSCSEGQSGSTVTCMHGSLIPIVSRQCGIDIDKSFGYLLADCSIEEIKSTVRELSLLSSNKLKDMARIAWWFARTHHTRERFAEVYSAAIDEIMQNRVVGLKVAEPSLRDATTVSVA